MSSFVVQTSMLERKIKHPRPLMSIRKYCIEDCCGDSKEVRLCPVTGCPLHDLRFGKNKNSESTIQIIKKRCHGCGEGTAQAVSKCEFMDCSLFPYRRGENPNRSGLGGEFPHKKC